MYYFDSAYVAKCYLNEPDSEPVRDLVRAPVQLYSSAICIAEVCCAIHAHARARLLSPAHARGLIESFRSHVAGGVWTLIPVSERLLWEIDAVLRTLPFGVFVRAADAIHLVSARSVGLSEIWTSDAQLLRAASHFGLTGRSV